MLTPWKKSYDQPREHVEKQRHYFANKGLYSQGYGFSSSHVWMQELDCEESWAPKNWCFWTVVLEKTLESPLDCKEIQPVHSRGDQSWVFFGRNDAEAETPHAKSWLIRKDSDTGKGLKQVKGITEAEMVGWHHQLNELELEQTPGDGEGQGCQAYFSPWSHKGSDMTEWLYITGKSEVTVALATYSPRHISSSFWSILEEWEASKLSSASVLLNWRLTAHHWKSDAQ